MPIPRNDKSKVTKTVRIERRYSDGSGVEFGVSLVESREIEFEAVDKVSFPVEEINFLIESLDRIKKEIKTSG